MCRIEKRDDSIDNQFQSVAYAVWDGGVQWHELSPPSGYDITEGNCGNGLPGGSSTICDPNHDKYIKAVRADRYIGIDYCTQVVREDRVTESVDYDNAEDTCGG